MPLAGKLSSQNKNQGNFGEKNSKILVTTLNKEDNSIKKIVRPWKSGGFAKKISEPD